MVKTGKNCYRFEKSEVPGSEIFTYTAFPERIVDGDTLLERSIWGLELLQSKGWIWPMFFILKKRRTWIKVFLKGKFLNNELLESGLVRVE
ncbi:MAG: hypothetical protein K8R21_14735 [Leptospira sp.]|nr:hypothetical protein [Leptospira sp.]